MAFVLVYTKKYANKFSDLILPSLNISCHDRMRTLSINVKCVYIKCFVFSRKCLALIHAIIDVARTFRNECIRSGAPSYDGP